MMDAPATAARDARVAWLVGGSLLIAYAVVRLFAGTVTMFFFVPGLATALDALWAAALLVFAFGVRRSGSVVARRPLGVVALVVAAVLPFVSAFVWRLVPLEATDQMLSIMIGETFLVISFAALVIATVVIARAGGVPRRVRWVPFIVLAAAAVPQLVAQLIGASSPGPVLQTILGVLLSATAFLGALAILLLGVMAIVFAPRERASTPTDATVQVYPPV